MDVRTIDKTIKRKNALRDITGIVLSSKQETSDTWTHYIYVDHKDKSYRAGQFLSIDPHQFSELNELIKYFEFVKGKKEKIRAYSIASAPNEEYVAITIKPEVFNSDDSKYPPLLSPFLASKYMEGRKIKFRGYTGSYYLTDNYSDDVNEILHIVAGSGVVPSFAILKDELLSKKNINVRHTMIYSNRTYKDIIFHRELELLALKFPERFKLIHFITREEYPQRYGINFFKGRPTFDLIAANVSNISKVQVFACGAAITRWQKIKSKEQGLELKPRFLDSIKSIITKLGVNKRRFKYEDYG
jgi:ferredoxin-NADP reductase